MLLNVKLAKTNSIWRPIKHAILFLSSKLITAQNTLIAMFVLNVKTAISSSTQTKNAKYTPAKT